MTKDDYYNSFKGVGKVTVMENTTRKDADGDIMFAEVPDNKVEYFIASKWRKAGGYSTPAGVKTKKAAPKVEAQESEPDDLTLIEGIGPKTASHLAGKGISSFSQLAESSPAQISEFLSDAKGIIAKSNPGTWPEQAGLAASGSMDELKDLQANLKGGVR